MKLCPPYTSCCINKFIDKERRRNRHNCLGSAIRKRVRFGRGNLKLDLLQQHPLRWDGAFLLSSAWYCSIEQQQPPEPFLPSMLLRTAVAHPTPTRTEIASEGQLRAHAPHSMQESLSEMDAFPSSFSNTLRAQTTAHMPQPEHFD
jgi:hypothetical protein